MAKRTVPSQPSQPATKARSDCPVAPLARQATKIIEALRRSGELREVMLQRGSADVDLKLQKREEDLTAYLGALTALASRLRATSAEGALFQISLMRACLDSVDVSGDAGRHVALGRLTWMLYSVAGFMEETTAAKAGPAEAFYMNPNLDPHNVVFASLQ